MEKKIAILTDIHGNNAALTAVLDEIDHDLQVEHIYCLGDLVGIGHETNEVLETLFSREDVSFVLGNHDEAILDILAGKEPESKGPERDHHKWIASRLNEQLTAPLHQIPKQLESNYNGKKFLFTHYHLNEENEFMTVDYEPTAKKLDEHYSKTNADVVCFGHHHVVHHFHSRQRLYFNPGALGCQYKPIAPYAMLTVGELGNINIDLKEVPYNNKDYMLAYSRLPIPAKDFVLKNFYGNQHLNYL
ncbi:phosphoesterase, MJ0936 family [Mesobacillus persicus]|uniref:Phosphoesterase, MJ0936 family n=1 Tax=Mesobacillus persicus TaxID=930146 RepID=A0A1H7YUT6_9BACI|nr:metallophosphoesterase family protein [Mesobacillus persicus]SEM49685.1 phosphoesterase, MJ0936 family [Mesobacillus persicus]